VDVTQVIRRDRGVGTAPPSLRAQILLVASAFLCGTVLAGLLFVGIWRHTADDGARAQASQRASQRQLTAARHRLAALQAELAHTKDLAAATAARAARDHAALTRQVAASVALARSLGPRLTALTSSALSLSSQVATLQSELKALGSYIAQPGATGIDAGYLAAQVQYMLSAAKSAVDEAAAISQRATDAGASLGKN
jgi:predicted  nucleic acid-binding Zn-ribbon protein